MIKRLIIAILGIFGLAISLNMKLEEVGGEKLFSTTVLIVSLLLILIGIVPFSKRNKWPS